MKMNRNLLLTASVFFVLLFTGCGIASIFYVETRISPFQESVPSTHTFRVTISDTKIPPNLDLIANGSAEHGQGGRPGSVCGAVGCIQACNAHLEAKRVLKGGVKG